MFSPQLQPATTEFISDSALKWIHSILHVKLASLTLLNSNMFILLNLHFSYNHVLGTILKLFQLILLVFIQCQVSDIIPLSELLWSQIGYPLPFSSDVDSLLKKG